jgi:hypothetical protein
LSRGPTWFCACFHFFLSRVQDMRSFASRKSSNAMFADQKSNMFAWRTKQTDDTQKRMHGQFDNKLGSKSSTWGSRATMGQGAAAAAAPPSPSPSPPDKLLPLNFTNPAVETKKKTQRISKKRVREQLSPNPQEEEAPPAKKRLSTTPQKRRKTSVQETLTPNPQAVERINVTPLPPQQPLVPPPKKKSIFSPFDTPEGREEVKEMDDSSMPTPISTPLQPPPNRFSVPLSRQAQRQQNISTLVTAAPPTTAPSTQKLSDLSQNKPATAGNAAYQKKNDPKPSSTVPPIDGMVAKAPTAPPPGDTLQETQTLNPKPSAAWNPIAPTEETPAAAPTAEGDAGAGGGGGAAPPLDVEAISKETEKEEEVEEEGAAEGGEEAPAAAEGEDANPPFTPQQGNAMVDQPGMDTPPETPPADETMQQNPEAQQEQDEDAANEEPEEERPPMEGQEDQTEASISEESIEAWIQNYESQFKERIQQSTGTEQIQSLQNQTRVLKDKFEVLLLQPSRRGESFSDYLRRASTEGSDPISNNVVENTRILIENLKKVLSIKLGNAANAQSQATAALADKISLLRTEMKDRPFDQQVMEELAAGPLDLLNLKLQEILQDTDADYEISKQTLETVAARVTDLSDLLVTFTSQIQGGDDDAIMAQVNASLRDVVEKTQTSVTQLKDKVSQMKHEKNFETLNKPPGGVPVGLKPPKPGKPGKDGNPVMKAASAGSHTSATTATDSNDLLVRTPGTTNPPTSMTTTPPMPLVKPPPEPIVVDPTVDPSAPVTWASSNAGYYGPYEAGSMQSVNYYPLPYDGSNLEFWTAARKAGNKKDMARPVYLSRKSGSNEFNKIQKKEMPKFSSDVSPIAKKNGYISKWLEQHR